MSDIEKLEFESESIFSMNIYQLNITTKPYRYIKSVNILYAPTANCQVYIIRNFQMILDNFNYEDQLLILNEISKKINKSCTLIDIKEKYYNDVKKLFETKSFILNKKYKSTNGSIMRTIIFKNKKIKK